MPQRLYYPDVIDDANSPDITGLELRSLSRPGTWPTYIAPSMATAVCVRRLRGGAPRPRRRSTAARMHRCWCTTAAAARSTRFSRLGRGRAGAIAGALACPGGRCRAARAPRPRRPKLGVVAREVTLLPRHWEWLAQQPAASWRCASWSTRQGAPTGRDRSGTLRSGLPFIRMAETAALRGSGARCSRATPTIRDLDRLWPEDARSRAPARRSACERDSRRSSS
jgi:hypothetical protein